MNNSMTIAVTCKDEATKVRYEALASKMREDSAFQSALKACTSENQVYELYLNNGYTDMDKATFKEQFKDMIDSIVSVQPASFELTEDELDNVVGGFSFFKMFTSMVSVIPIAGPLIAGVAKAIKAGIDGEGACGVVKNLAVGLGLAMVDSVVTIATMGTGAAITGAAKTAMQLGMAGVKFGLNSALE